MAFLFFFDGGWLFKAKAAARFQAHARRQGRSFKRPAPANLIPQLYGKLMAEFYPRRA